MVPGIQWCYWRNNWLEAATSPDPQTDRATEGISSEAYEIPRFVRCQPVDLGSQTDAPAVRTVARKR